MLATRRDSQFLRHFPQLLEETEHFCGCGQEKVAKIVQCGEPKTLAKSNAEAADDGGLSRLCRFLCQTV
jgi:hypothetical protein